MIKKMGFEGLCRTTAMGIMPHRDAEKALGLSLGLDIPFWPQLPNVSYFEDMYAQASEHFPGVVVDVENKRIYFDRARFDEDILDYSTKMGEESTFSLSERHSVVYHRFLSEDLSRYPAIRGQVIGPVSYGFKITDGDNRPIIYDDEVRALLFDFIQRKVDAQYHELKEKNANAFVWLDEPGLGWVFSGLSGYGDLLAKKEYGDFLGGLDGPGALHLCANVNLPYLLSLGVALLSFDAYQIELMPKAYAQAVADYVTAGGIISWGIVPTDSSALAGESPESLSERLAMYWNVVASNSMVSASRIAQQALIAPARCCLRNVELVSTSKAASIPSNACPAAPEEELVEKAFEYVKKVSRILQRKFDLTG